MASGTVRYDRPCSSAGEMTARSPSGVAPLKTVTNEGIAVYRIDSAAGFVGGARGIGQATQTQRDRGDDEAVLGDGDGGGRGGRGRTGASLTALTVTGTVLPLRCSPHRRCGRNLKLSPPT